MNNFESVSPATLATELLRGRYRKLAEMLGDYMKDKVLCHVYAQYELEDQERDVIYDDITELLGNGNQYVADWLTTTIQSSVPILGDEYGDYTSMPEDVNILLSLSGEYFAMIYMHMLFFYPELRARFVQTEERFLKRYESIFEVARFAWDQEAMSYGEDTALFLPANVLRLLRRDKQVRFTMDEVLLMTELNDGRTVLLNMNHDVDEDTFSVYAAFLDGIQRMFVLHRDLNVVKKEDLEDILEVCKDNCEDTRLIVREFPSEDNVTVQISPTAFTFTINGDEVHLDRITEEIN